MKIRRVVFLPNLFTLGNGICGFAALVKTYKVGIITTPAGALQFDHPQLFATAAWLILLGMVFDVFDGKVARLSGRTSDLGAQLDSLCDLTTFGLAPAALVIRLNMVYPEMWGKVTWFFCLAYFLGALLRLARFNAENDHDESAHLCFKGLPSPAAAGCVASLVIFHRYVLAFHEKELVWLGQWLGAEAIQGAVGWIPQALPILMLVLGYTMVSSRLKYDHLASRIFNRGHSFEFMVSLIFGVILLAVFPEVVLPIMFIGYLASTPISALVGKIRSFRRGSGPGSPGASPGSRSGHGEEVELFPPGAAG
jgi:CDP-diacylglycerol--serine O-phosphatidyltransferase